VILQRDRKLDFELILKIANELMEQLSNATDAELRRIEKVISASLES